LKSNLLVDAELGSVMKQWLKLVCVILSVALLYGCAAGTQAFRDGSLLIATGKFDDGLGKLEEAVKLEPNNAEYRIALSNTRASLINQLNTSAEAARREGKLSDAEKAYRQVQAYDPGNVMAKQGMEAIVTERRHRLAVADAETLFKKGSNTDIAEALELLRPILDENPNQRDALNLKARLNEARAKETPLEARLGASFKKPVTLEFREAPLNSVFQLIAKISGLNFFFDKDIRPDLKTSIIAKNTSVEDAVRLILVTNQLEQMILNENSILIYPATPQKLKDYQALSVRTFYLANADVKAVSNTIKTIIKTKDMVVDERLGILIMRDTPQAIRMAERIVALQDLSDPEVMLEVEVLELKRSRLLDLGISWPSQLTLSPLQISGSSLTLDDLRNLNSQTIQASIGNLTINANKTDSDGNILANPKIRVRNKEKATVLIGDRVPVITTTSTSTGFASESVNYIDVGLKLEVEPNIYLDEEVAIKVNLEVSTIVKEITSNSGTLSYQIGTRGANTVLRLRNGETQILAGLIQENDQIAANKIPLLGELPVASRLFGSQKDTADRSEILLSITPHIVRSIRRPDIRLAEFESGTETNIGSPPLRLSQVEPANPEKKADKPGDTNTVEDKTAPKATTTAALVPAVAGTNASVGTGGTTSFTWQAPAQVKVGEQFSAVLRINSQTPLRGLPMMAGFDPQVLQVVNVQEGDFLKRDGARTTFIQRVDPTQGKVFMTSVRRNDTGTDAGINGAGNVAIVTFKALKAASAKVQLLSVSPEPKAGSPVQVPVEQTVQVVP
jgi:general secretion pathway protein D